MAERNEPEVWLRGPVEGIPALLQPVAHSLLQAREEVRRVAEELPESLVWSRPGGVASAGFHLRHVAGVVDRLFTYARGEPLSDTQLARLAEEAEPGSPAPSVGELLEAFETGVKLALRQLSSTEERRLTEAREVGRSRLPSTVLGLYVHAAEHVQRHVGQLLVTVRVQVDRE